MTEQEIAELLSQVDLGTGYLRQMDLPYLSLAEQLGLDIDDTGDLYALSTAVNSYRAGAPIDALRAALEERLTPEEVLAANYGNMDPNRPELSFGAGYGMGAGAGWANERFDPNSALARGYMSPKGVNALGYSSGGHGGVAFGDVIGQVKDDMRDRQWQGIGRVAMLVGGAAAAGALGGANAGAGAGGTQTGQATVSATDAFGGIAGDLAPNGLITGSASAAGGGVGTLSGAVPAVGASPGVGAGAGASVLSRIKDFGRGLVKNPDGSLNWTNIARMGAGAAGLIGSRGAESGDAAPPPSQYDDTPLRRLDYKRERNAGPNDYFSYGRGPSGGEHRFFQDAEFVDSPLPNAQPGGTPNGETPSTDHMIRDPRRLPGLRVLAHGGSAQHVRGPGSGREDLVEALLSADEYVIDAETVAMLGDGSPEEGARRLDEMRQNVRRHKGKALAKGKFSPNAKAPEQYIGKSRGGVIKKVVKGGVPPPTMDDKRSRLEAIRRFEAAFRAAARNRQEPVKKARGGVVGKSAMTSLVRLANQLERALQLGNVERVGQLSTQLDAYHKGASSEGIKAFARGGSVTAALRKLVSAAKRAEPEPPPIPNQMKVLDMESVARELEKIAPDSPVLRQYRSSRVDRRYTPRPGNDRRQK